jgi:mannosyltransferase OCH1-like enzyme
MTVSLLLVALVLVVALCAWECTASRGRPARQTGANSRTNIDLRSGYKLPVIPQSETENFDLSLEIPKNIWMTTKYPEVYKQRANHFLMKNRDCAYHVLGDDGMDEFMVTKFANTSVLWAYAMINPKLVAAKVDIWRIATLWLNGGLYMDADSALSVPFDKVVGKEDRFIF